MSSLTLMALLVASLVERPESNAGGMASRQPPLVIYCAASNKGVLEAIQRDYEKESGIPLQVQYGGSQSLLASLMVTRTGDLFLPADDSYLKMARELDLITDEFPLAEMHAVVAVPLGNPKGIQSLADLLRSDVRLAQGSAEATAIGKLTQSALTTTNQWEDLKRHTTVFKTTVNEVANDIKIGAVDAGIVYDAVLHDYETLESVSIPELHSVRAHVAVALLKASRQSHQARHFARYLAADDKGLARYREFGFHGVEGHSSDE